MKKMKMKKLDPMANVKAVGGGLAADVIMNMLDTNVSQFSDNALYSPGAVAAAGILGQMFAPKEYKELFLGMEAVAGVELARSAGIIKGINDGLGDIVPSLFNKVNTRVQPPVIQARP